MKQRRKTLLLLTLTTIFFLSFALINTVLNKKPVLAEDKDIYTDSIASENSPSDISEDDITEEGIDDSNKINSDTDLDINTDEILESLSPSLDGTSYIDEEGNTIITNTDDILVLVNKSRNLPSDYKPEDLVIPNVKFSFEEALEKKYMRKEAATALEELFNDANENELYIFAVSGYRSYKTQKSLFAAYANKYGEEAANTFSAFAGQSEHQTGLAMDVSCRSEGFRLTEEFGQTPEGQWLKENAHRFGFIIRYPEDRTEDTGYCYEPWHIRYVGTDAAKVIKDNNLILEEYFADSDD